MSDSIVISLTLERYNELLEPIDKAISRAIYQERLEIAGIFCSNCLNQHPVNRAGVWWHDFVNDSITCNAAPVWDRVSKGGKG